MFDVKCRMTILVLSLLVADSVCYAADSAADDDWFAEDSEPLVLSVNEGELRILDDTGAWHNHHHHTQVTISKTSLVDGWVDMVQCHQALDPVPALQIVYHPHRVRELKIDSSQNIAKARVDGGVVELEQVQPDSAICLSLQSKALHREGRQWLLKNGPFMRRFLDGYYPIRITMEVWYPQQMMNYATISPDVLAAKMRTRPGRLELDVRFEGRLETGIGFTVLP